MRLFLRGCVLCGSVCTVCCAECGVVVQSRCASISRLAPVHICRLDRFKPVPQDEDRAPEFQPFTRGRSSPLTRLSLRAV